MININKFKSNNIKFNSVNFITFADNRFYSSLNRIKKQAQKTGIINNVKIMNQIEILKYKDQYLEIFKNLNKNNRGFGFWAWKPLIIYKELESLKDNSILIYADAGFHIRSEGNLKLLEYIYSLSDERPILLFGNYARLDSDLESPFRGLDWKNYQYIKKETLDFFHLSEEEEFLNNQQIAGGLIIILINKISRNFINQWLSSICSNFNLIDSKLRVEQSKGFIAHRHDQAILSCLSWLNKKNIIFRSLYEIYYPSYKGSILRSDWSKIKNYPFHARRDLGILDFIVKRMQFRLKRVYERTRLK
jgi:hypothetical protein